jgi:hypothetical protein
VLVETTGQTVVETTDRQTVVETTGQTVETTDRQTVVVETTDRLTVVETTDRQPVVVETTGRPTVRTEVVQHCQRPCPVGVVQPYRIYIDIGVRYI